MSDLTPYHKPQELKWFTIIGWYQMVGGLVGMSFLLWLFAHSSSLLALLIIAIGIGLNGFSIFAGRQLKRKQFFKPTYIIQTAQILNFVGFGVTFQMVIGLAAGVGFEWIENAEIVFNFKVLSLYEFEYQPYQTDAIRIVVNFVPVLIINYLMKRKAAAAERKRLADYSSTSF